MLRKLPSPRLVILGALPVALMPVSLPADTELNIPGYRIVWQDEFEGAAVDTSKWDVNVGVNAWYQRESDGRFVEPHWFNDDFEPWIQAGTINDERQYYSPDNVAIEDGVLVIRAEQETVADPIGIYDPEYHRYTSGKLNTADEFQFRFGIVKWRAQLPAGQGMWPALWMLNAPDPWRWDDEIDVMEARGSQPFITTSAHHFKVGENQDNVYNSGSLDAGVNLQEGFHEYGLEWKPDSIQTWLDDRDVFFDDVAIPQGPMFLIMNAAVGGAFDGVPSDDGIFPSFFKIDWVRVWQPASSPGDLANGDFEDEQAYRWANWNTVEDGNLSPVTIGALHGAKSVRIARPEAPPPPDAVSADLVSADPVLSNLLTDGTAGDWQGYLNEIAEDASVLAGYFIDPASIPATTSADGLTLSVHQSAPSPQANAVLFKQIDGPPFQGSELTFSGSVEIEETFPDGTEAIAFIRIFDPSYNFTDVKTSVHEGGNFSVQAPIPESNVLFIQAGLETTGPTGSTGRLAATGLTLTHDGQVDPDPDPDPEPNAGIATGLVQTTIATPGQPVRYGLLAANDPADPMGSTAAGDLQLIFLDAEKNVISESTTTIVDADTSTTATPFTMESIAPEDAAYARMIIERAILDAESDQSGSFIVDAAFLQSPDQSELPVLVSEPLPELTVPEGQAVSLPIEIISPTPVTFTWYHEGEKVGSDAEHSFTASTDSEGTYFVVASNAAGPVIGAITEVTVVEPAPDTDGDRISDEDEINVYETNPEKADSDGDGIDDYGEIFISLTDPNDPQSALRITDITLADEQVALTFKSVPGVDYEVHAGARLDSMATTGISLTATDTVSILEVDTGVSDPPLQFFKIHVDP